MIIQFEFEYNTDTKEFLVVNKETGECKSVKVSKPKKKKKEENPNPQLILEENKYHLTEAAVELLGVEKGDKIDIKYEKIEGVMRPVIGTDEVFGTKGGNALNQSNNVPCRGVKHTELEKYGTIFDVIKHPERDGLFILKGDKEIKIEELSEEVTDLPIDLEDLIDGDKEEVDVSMFQL